MECVSEYHKILLEMVKSNSWVVHEELALRQIDEH